MDRKAVLRWKAGMEEMNRLDLEERQARTPAQRLRNHQAFLEGHVFIGLARSKSEKRVHRMPYHEIQERWLARHP